MAPLLAPTRASRRADDVERFERFFETRDSTDRDELIERHLPLARHLARRYAAGSDRDDLEQVASLGLVKAVDRYDPSRGFAFASFAVPTILGEIKRYFRDLGWSVRPPRELQELSARMESVVEELTAELGRSPTTAEIAERCDVSEERVVEARTIDTAHFALSLDVDTSSDEPGFERAEDAADLQRLLDTLTPRERVILRLRFEEDMVQRDIGALLGISQMQVSRLIRQATAKLRQAAESQSALSTGAAG
ncbi:MAG TPA: sigma-70 family RNA polymerase sigma factor [Solirubrobacter sp.]|jgi:RNA polymerase sigma-B factor|nr:sigma-70 family RNA polymerase sigma factor [Solirubrobacter sp.]